MSVKARRFVHTFAAPADTQLFAFESTAGTSNLSSCALEASATHVHEGTNSLKATGADNAVDTKFDFTLASGQDHSNLLYYEVWAYVESAENVSYTIYATESNFGNNLNWSGTLVPGWNTLILGFDKATVAGTKATALAAMKVFRFNARNSGLTAPSVIHWDDLRVHLRNARTGYVIQDGSGTILDAISSLDNITVSGDTAHEIVDHPLADGTVGPCLHVTGAAGSAINVDIDLGDWYDFTQSRMWSFEMHNNSSANDTWLMLGKDPAFGGAYQKNQGAFFLDDWGKMTYSRAIFGTVGAPSFEATRYVRIRITGVTAKDLYFANLRKDECWRPKVVLTTDDGRGSVATIMQPILDAYGLKSTNFINPGLLGSETYTRMTLAQVQALHEAGHDIGNHTWEHTVLGAATYAECIAALGDCHNWLIENGFTRNGEHLHGAWPNGEYTSISTQAARDIGLKTMRTTGSARYQDLDTVKMNGLGLAYIWATNTVTLAQMITAIKAVHSNDGVAIILFHDITADAETVGNEWSAAKLTGLCQWLVSHRPEFDTVTMSELYNSIEAT